MLEKLLQIAQELPQVMRDSGTIEQAEWQGLYIDYHAPIVERLWKQWDADTRVCLHRIHPCEPQETLFHPHPWPSAVLLIDGSYEQRMGYSDFRDHADEVAYPENHPPKSGRMLLATGCAYEMIDPNEWHSVRPLERPSLSLMVMGKPYGLSGWWAKAPKKELRPLTDHERRKLWDDFFHHSTIGP